jgi:hypothetical protein
MRAASVIMRLQISDDLDFDQRTLRQLCDLDCRSGRIVAAEKACVYLIHFREVIHIVHEAGGLDDLVQTTSRCFEHRLEVRKNLSGLHLDIALHQISGRRVDRNLPRLPMIFACA